MGSVPHTVAPAPGAATVDLGQDFRLPADVRPSRYELRFELDLDAWAFRALERIAVRLAAPRSEIFLHAVDLDIRSARASRDGRAEEARVSSYAEAEAVSLRFPAELAAGEWTLELEFSGAIREDLRGIYRSTRGSERYALTQLAAADARRAFPCFDEPEFKARFALALVAAAENAFIANMPIVREERLAGGRMSVTFAETPPISSYLLAFAVGPFEATPPAATPTGVPCRVWVPRGLAGQALFARDAHARSLAFLEEYTAIPYPYTKVDAIGCPDFAAGAMENPGAVTYRLRLLATDPATTSIAVLRGAFGTIAHELTHMWWGDLATLKWWDDIWLNEAFATIVGYKTTAALNPEWREWRDFLAGVSRAFSLDALASTHPISGEVRNAKQASERFDEISYEKGAAVLRMIERYLGEDVFRDGVRVYLRRYAESNATADDFWRALDEASRQDVSRVANAWIKEPGHPLVTCEAERKDDGLRVALRQRRFFGDPAAEPGPQRWPVPVVIRYGTAGGPREARLLVDGERATVELPGARWFFPNADAAGFYRFALDDASFRDLVAHVAELTPEERLLLVDDVWALARAAAAPLGQVFALLRSLRGEEDRAVLARISAALGWLSTHAVGDDARPGFERFVDELFHDKLGALGWAPRDDEPQEDRLKRRLVIEALGRVARSRLVRVEALRRIHGYLAGGERLDPDVASAAASVAAAQGDGRLFDRYVARVRESAMKDPQEEQRFRFTLADFEAPELVQRCIEACFSDLVRAQDLPQLLARLLGSRFGRDAAWRALRERWDRDIATLDPWLRQAVVESCAQLTPRRYVDEVVAFLEAKRTDDTREVTTRAIERLRIDAASAERLAGEVQRALT